MRRWEVFGNARQRTRKRIFSVTAVLSLLLLASVFVIMYLRSYLSKRKVEAKLDIDAHLDTHQEVITEREIEPEPDNHASQEVATEEETDSPLRLAGRTIFYIVLSVLFSTLILYIFPRFFHLFQSRQVIDYVLRLQLLGISISEVYLRVWALLGLILLFLLARWFIGSLKNRKGVYGLHGIIQVGIYTALTASYFSVLILLLTYVVNLGLPNQLSSLLTWCSFIGLGAGFVLWLIHTSIPLSRREVHRLIAAKEFWAHWEYEDEEWEAFFVHESDRFKQEYDSRFRYFISLLMLIGLMFIVLDGIFQGVNLVLFIGIMFIVVCTLIALFRIGRFFTQRYGEKRWFSTENGPREIYFFPNQIYLGGRSYLIEPSYYEFDEVKVRKEKLQSYIRFVTFMRENDPIHAAPRNIDVPIPQVMVREPEGRPSKEVQNLIERYKQQTSEELPQEGEVEKTAEVPRGSRPNKRRPNKMMVITAVCVMTLFLCSLIAITLVYPSSYSAQAPGSCDKSNNHSYSWSQGGLSMASCPGNSLRLLQQKSRFVAKVYFHADAQAFPSKAFPSNYFVNITVVDMTSHACGGVLVRNRYLAEVCSNGTWDIQMLDNSGYFHHLICGTIILQNSYRLWIVVKNSSIGLAINGGSPQMLSDVEILDTNSIALVVGNDDSSTASAATFSDFQYTPTP